MAETKGSYLRRKSSPARRGRSKKRYDILRSKFGQSKEEAKRLAREFDKDRK